MGAPCPGGSGDKPEAPKEGVQRLFLGGNPSSFRRGAAQPGPPAPLLSRSLPRPGSRGIPRAAPAELYRGRRQGGSCHPPRVRESATLAPKKLRSAAILVLVEFSCFFFFFSLGGGWGVRRGGNRGCRAQHRAGLNFSLRCLAEVLTVRNTTEFQRKENIVRYRNIYSLHHQRCSEPEDQQRSSSPEESPGFFSPCNYCSQAWLYTHSRSHTQIL